MTLTVPNAIKKRGDFQEWKEILLMLPYLIIKTMDFPHCPDCLQLENIALGHLTTIYSRLNGVNNCCEMPPKHYQLNKRLNVVVRWPKAIFSN
jgi:hypothetical protein